MLCLSNTRATDELIAGLVTAMQRSHPTHLELQHVQRLTLAHQSALAAALATNTSVTHLTVAHAGLEAASVWVDVLRRSTALTHLDFCGNDFGDAGITEMFQAVAASASVVSLNVANNRLTAAGVAAAAGLLAANPRLRDLHLGLSGPPLPAQNCGTAEAPFTRSIAEHPSLTVLNLRGLRLGPGGVAQIARAAQESRTLANLELWGNEAGEAGAVAIAALLEVSASLTVLGLNWNSVGAGGGRALARGLRANKGPTPLRQLHLTGNQTGAGVLGILAPFLCAQHCALSVLELASNALGAQAGSIFGAVLRVNQSLRVLNLADNDLALDGAQQLAAGLRENKSLDTLNLSRNLLYAPGALVILRALATHPTLRSLGLRLNFLDETTFSDIVRELKGNFVLADIDVVGNDDFSLPKRDMLARFCGRGKRRTLTLLLASRRAEVAALPQSVWHQLAHLHFLW